MPNRITLAREALGLSQSALAIKLGVSRRTIQYWESGKGKPGKLAALAIYGLMAKEGNGE